MGEPRRRWRWLVLLCGGAFMLWLRNRGTARGYRDTPFWRAYDWVAQTVDHWIGWDKLPTPLGLVVLVGLRNILRQKNLHDTTHEPASGATKVPLFDSAFLTSRTPDGSYNDLGAPSMGMAGTRFGRNVPIEAARPETEPRILEPNPRVVSQALLTRREFIPAETVNLLAASWIQFMVHDWFSHGAGDPKHAWEVPVSSNDRWFERPMRILKTLPDPTAPDGTRHPATFLNTETHWWDASQIYGTTPEGQARRRSYEGGRLKIAPDGRLALPTDPEHDPTRVPGWWLGFEMMVTLFVREHNAVCDRLRAEYPAWTDEELFRRGRLIVSALMAKIHTAEWTPAIISHPTTVAALRANWWGIAGERVRKTFGRISKSEVVSGIPGSEHDHYEVPYALTEEFTIVYRMHPLIPDVFGFRAAADDRAIEEEKTFREIAGPAAHELTERVPLDDLFYTFGTSHPGAIVLHNFPRFLQEFQRPDRDDIYMDLAAIDILRARELGVPRYNEFRRLIHVKPAASFLDLTGGDAHLAAEISGVYEGIEQVDLTVGMFAEPRPTGFGFSDTAFRIFILMASRRLNSDRFFTDDFTPEVYSPVGIQWVQDNSMLSVLLRHCPELRPAVRGVANAFQPWTRPERPPTSTGH